MVEKKRFLCQLCGGTLTAAEFVDYQNLFPHFLGEFKFRAVKCRFLFHLRALYDNWVLI